VYATGRPQLLHAPTDSHTRWLGIVAAAAPGAVYGIAFAIAKISPAASLLIYALVPILYFVIITLARNFGPTGSAQRDFT
jgi:hypothetical protein